MAFLKFINETVTYPYNTKTDYPHTGFPPGADYPEFNVYWVYPVPPNSPINNSATEGTPVFNAELSRWEQTWSYTPTAPLPDWAGLRADLLGSTTIAAWFDGLPAIHREDITAQIQGQDTATLADAVVRVDYDPVKVELNQFLTDRNIGAQLP